eukprot:713372-Pyramimonas_sp.AAC.1
MQARSQILERKAQRSFAFASEAAMMAQIEGKMQQLDAELNRSVANLPGIGTPRLCVPRPARSGGQVAQLRCPRCLSAECAPGRSSDSRRSFRTSRRPPRNRPGRRTPSTAATY